MTTTDTVIGMLRIDEVPYRAAAALVDEATADELAALVAGADAPLAARIASLAAYLPPDLAARLCTPAAADPRAHVRAAAATALPVLAPDVAAGLAGTLLADEHDTVRLWALRGVDSASLVAVGPQVRALVRDDVDVRVRALAEDLGQRLG